MRKINKILHGIGRLAFLPVLLSAFFLCGCGKADSALLVAAEESETESKASGVVSSTDADAAGNGDTASSAAGVDNTDSSAAGTDGADVSEADSTMADGLYVYICGEVIHPGVYILDATARLCDAVEAAGGMTESASRTYWNLAMQLSDGQMIYIPTVEEAAERDFSPLSDDAAGGAGTADGTKSAGDSGDSQGAGSSQSADGSGSASAGISADGRVNINTATKEQLMTVPGIGSAKADSIIAYREANGAFASIDAIMNVSGIKEGLFQSLKEYITVD